MPKRVIKFTLDEKDIDRAITEVTQFKNELLEKCKQLVEALTEHGAEVARLQVRKLDAVYSGELMNSIDGYYSSNSNVGIIRAGAYYAAYVEFGTGVVGSRAPHPDPQNWQYDVNQHGDKGWVYYDDENGQFRWTKGFKSRPFMYNTAMQLEKECLKIAQDVFGR